MYLYPVAYSAWVSLYEWDLVMPARWVGGANYRALASAEFLEVVTNTVKYSVGVVVLSQVLGLALAVLLNDRTRLGALLQAHRRGLQVGVAVLLQADRRRLDRGGRC